MGKAAQQLNTTQPNISRTIADLEHALGVRLLDRHPQGIMPTAYGRALLDCGTAVFDDLRRGVKAIEALSEPGVGEVRIGSTIYTGETFVTTVIERLSRRYPRIVFHLVTSDETDTLYRELSERNVDFLIARRGSRFSNERYSFETLYDPSLVVMAGSRSRWTRRRRIALADLVDEPWVLPPPEGIMGPAYLEAFRASGLEHPRIAVFATQPGARLNLVATGRFLTMQTSVWRFSKSPNVTVLPVKLRHARAPVEIIGLKNRTLSPAAQLFIETAREIAKPLAGRNL
jgi:DNA-binding transcriptional LysR family regulator